MRDVAALAGVSLKTVSRVVNDEPGVSTTLAVKVRRAAGQLNFQANLGARSLRRADGRTATIGLVLENIANPYSANVHRAVEDAARERGVAVLASSLDEDPGREREIVAAFTSRRVDGLIIMPTGEDHSYLADERRAGTALVFVDRRPAHLDADVILTDNREATRRGVEHLLAHGHRRVGFVSDLAGITTARERHAGYLEALGAAGLPILDEDVVTDVGSADAAEAATLLLLVRTDAPTALFTAQNMVTIGALRAVRRLNRQNTLAMLGFDDFPLADLLDPPVSVLAQDPYAIGRRAAERLFARIHGDDSPTRTELVETRLVARGSGELPGPAMT